MTIAVAAVYAAAANRPAAAAGSPWTVQTSGVTARLRGVSAVNDRVAWASGARGTILRTIDGGRTWQPRPIPGTETLDFRDIDAIDDRIAYVLSIGNGEASRIFKTVDGGEHWDLQLANKDPKVFLDAMAFWDATHGIAVSDSDANAFQLFATTDGRTWARVPAAGLPPALPNEGAFAASGTNLAVVGARDVWLGTGAAATARVLRSRDGGRTWTIASTPLDAGPSAGIFSIAFRDTRHGVIVGGDYKLEKEARANLAITNDGGATWTLVTDRGLSGFRSVVAYIPRGGSQPPSLLAIGPAGCDSSKDDGQTWQPVECAGYHAFSVARTAASSSTPVGWAVGEEGRIARWNGLP